MVARRRAAGHSLVGKPETGNETLEYAASEFAKANKGLASSSQTLYARAVNEFVAWAARQELTLLRSVESAHIRQYFEAHTEWSRTTAKGYLIFLGVFFNFCRKSPRRWIPYSPTEDKTLRERGKKGRGAIGLAHSFHGRTNHRDIIRSRKDARSQPGHSAGAGAPSAFFRDANFGRDVRRTV